MRAQNSLKNQILTESVKILGSHGFEGLSLREVAKRLNVTHQAPYHYFPDKNSVVLEIKKVGFKMLGEAIEKALKESKSEDVLIDIGLTYFDFCLQNPGYFRAMFAPNATGDGVRVAEAQRAFECFKTAIMDSQKDVAHKNRDPEILTMICWTYMHGLVALAMDKYPVLGGKYELRDLAQQMVRQMNQLLRG